MSAVPHEDPQEDPIALVEGREATIRTAQITIRAMTVNKRQVTMGLFRQLLNEPVIDRQTGELLGIPWGTVNYFWGDCVANHYHVVWQKGGELRRSCVFNDISRLSGHKEAMRWNNLTWSGYVLAHYLAHGVKVRGLGIHGPVGEEYEVWFNCTDKSSKAEFPRAFQDRRDARKQAKEAEEQLTKDRTINDDWYKDYYTKQLAMYRKNITEAEAALADWFSVNFGTADYAIIGDLSRQAGQALAAFERRWEESFAQVADSGQLFIAT